MHRLFQSALLIGARVRSETKLGNGAASVPSAAVAVAGKIFGDLAGRSALILGAGDMAELAAQCLVKEGARVTLVANRTYERARAIAEQLDARALTLEEAWPHFAETDIVLCSTSAPHAVVTWERVAGVIQSRGRRPLCILDLAVPRDVDPAVGQLENVFLYTPPSGTVTVSVGFEVSRPATSGRNNSRPVRTALLTVHNTGSYIAPEEAERVGASGRRSLRSPAELERAIRRFKHLAPEDQEQLEQPGGAAQQVSPSSDDCAQGGCGARPRIRLARIAERALPDWSTVMSRAPALPVVAFRRGDPAGRVQARACCSR
jgi:glutamyl-tRNA reductase